jgi:excisionase family DNA binding protein
MDNDRMMTTTEAAAYMRCSPMTLESWRQQSRSKGPPFIRISHRKVLYRKADLDAFLNQHRHPSAGDARVEADGDAA